MSCLFVDVRYLYRVVNVINSYILQLRAKAQTTRLHREEIKSVFALLNTENPTLGTVVITND